MEALKHVSTKQLIEIFVLTGQEDAEDIPTVRGWIMDELKARNPEAFDKWLEDFNEDEDLYKYFK